MYGLESNIYALESKIKNEETFSSADFLSDSLLLLKISFYDNYFMIVFA